MTVGTKVTWTNTGSAPHTSTSGAPGNQTDVWNSPTMGTNDQFSFTFNDVGTFKYFCRFHSSMKATVTVLAAVSAISTATPASTVTQAASFTFGSHKDDVARIQGTPTSVVVYRALGEEVWGYVSSSVTFDTNTNQVIEWNDLSNNLKVGGE